MKKSLILVIFMVFLGISCNSMPGKKEMKKVMPKGDVVINTMNGGGYTFLELKNDKGKFWAATGEVKINKGDVIELKNPILMKNFESKSLKRTFKEIYFAEGLRVLSGDSKAQTQSMKNPHEGMNMEGITMGDAKSHMKDTTELDVSKIDKVKDGVTLGEILKDPKAYDGKEVKVKVAVVKFMAEIMGKNWLHLKDSTTKEGHMAAISESKFKKGDIVVITAKVVTDKDFGHGYKYKVLLENVKIVK